MVIQQIVEEQLLLPEHRVRCYDTAWKVLTLRLNRGRQQAMENMIG